MVTNGQQHEAWRIGVGVTTAPREGPPVLERCLASLAKTGFDRPLLFAEPDTRWASWVSAAVDVVQRTTRCGAWYNWLYGLEATLRRRARAEAVLMVQDDVVFCRNVCALLLREMWPSRTCGAIQVSTSSRYKNILPPGLHPLAGKWLKDLSSACAVLFPCDVASAIVRHGRACGWRGHPRQTIAEPTEKKAIDTFIGQTLVDLGYELWGHNPALGDHIGQYSTLNHSGLRGARVALAFPGEQADALQLF